MIRSLRLPALARQPLVTGSTTPSPLQRLPAQTWRTRTSSRNTTTAGATRSPARSIHDTAGAAKPAARGCSLAPLPPRGSQPPRSPAAGRTTQTLLTRPQRRNFNWSWSRSSQPSGGAGAKEPPSLSLSQRLKKLSREYGWSAVGVYLALSVLDFPFCFLLVKWVGTDRIGELEHWIMTNVKRFIPESVKQSWNEWRAAVRGVEQEQLGDNHISEDVEMVGWGVEEAQERHKADAGLATQLALAYAIHKSFIFLRVPLTAAVTPKVVKILRSWGWQIGKRRPKSKR